MSEQVSAKTPPSTPPTPSTPPPPPARGGGGFVRFLGRLFSALLVIVLTTATALAVGAFGLLWLGFTPDMPSQLQNARNELATAQAQIGPLETRVAEQEARLGAVREDADELQKELTAFGLVRSELATSVAQNATVVAEARDSRLAVLAFATAEASRAQLLAELNRRSERVERFINRLGDIASDTALDLTNVTPTAGVSPTAVPATTPQTTNTPVPSATAVPTPTTTPRPTP